MSDIKKKANADITSKRLKVKNKKDVAKVLTKNKTTAVTAKKSSNVRKKPTVKKSNKPKVVNQNQQPAVKKEENITQVQETKPIVNEKEVKSAVSNRKNNKKVSIKKTGNEEVKAVKVDNINNIKKKADKLKNEKKKANTTNKTKAPSSKKVKSVYDPEKNRWVLKEDKSKDKKPDNKQKAKQQPSQQVKLPQEESPSYVTDRDLGGFKNKFFEEVNVNEYKTAQKEKRKGLPKKLFIFLLVVVVLFGIGFIVYRINQERIKANLNLYDKYKVGQEVILKDGSKWYVVTDSDGSKPNVELLDSGLVDYNRDGKINDKDKFRFSSGSLSCNKKDETNLCYFLENTYRPYLEGKVGELVKITSFDSKQFVRVREELEYGWEWNNDNILTSSKMYNYWLATSQKERMYVVSRKGSYKMVKPTATYYARVVITISKDSIKKD